MSKVALSMMVMFCAIATVSTTLAGQGRMTVTLQAGEFDLMQTPGGDRIEMDGFGLLMNPGKPLLPMKRFLFLLPLGARATSVTVISTQETVLPGHYDIEPFAGILPIPGSPFFEEQMERLRIEWQQNHESVYFNDEPYPDELAWLAGTGTLRKYSYASVSYSPFSFNPVSGGLVLHDQIGVVITYSTPDEGSAEAEHFDRLRADCIADERARELFPNYHEFAGCYLGSEVETGLLDETWDFVIITTGNLVNSINSSGFVDWKTELGFSVKTVLITDSEITSQPGSDLAEQIRNFLRSHYNIWSIEYVLFVGNYAAVPMRICYPDSSYHVYDPSNPGLIAPGTPTDCYYADLSFPDSISWDLDGDGYLGEYNQDVPDFMPEVSVGRIPVSNSSRVTYALSKTVTFEQDTGSWKTNVLHAGSILFFENQNYSGYPFIDGATLLDSIETGLMSGYSITHMSEQAGLVTSPFPWPPISEIAFSNAWRNGQYAVVNWSGHGWPNGASRTVWLWDDGDGVPESANGELVGYPFININSTDLDDDHPSVVFAVSCDVGYPEPNPYGNCGIDLLTKPGWGASIGIVSAARPASISADWKNLPGGTEQICFDFNRYLVAEEYRVGDALYWGKYDANSVYGWESVYEYMNLYNFNLFGEPSLELGGVYTGIAEGSGLGDGILLSILPGEPNPFSSSCSIGFTLSSASHIEISVFDLHGRQVRTLLDEMRLPGEHTVPWNGTDGNGEQVPSGVYFVHASAGARQAVEKLVFIR